MEVESENGPRIEIAALIKDPQVVRIKTTFITLFEKYYFVGFLYV